MPEDLQTDTDPETAGSETSESQTTESDTTETESTDVEVAAPTDSPDEGVAAGRGSRADRLEQEGDVAADFLEDLLDIADLDGDIDMDVDGNRAAVSIVGGNLRDLVGRDGEVLEALQELTRLAVFRETGERSRLMLDVDGFRAQRRVELVELAQRAITEVKGSGESIKLEPMSPFERKVVHDAVADAGLSSASEGEETKRCVVVLPAS